MAFYPIIRKASMHTTIPLALRAIGFSRTRGFSIHAAKPVSTVVGKKNQSDDVFDRNLIRLLNSEIKCVVDSDLFTVAVDVPTGFPFKVEDNDGGRTIVLTREFEGENIRIKVDMPGKKDCTSDELEIETSIPIVVTVSKVNYDSCLQFGLRCFPDRFSIHSLSLSKSGNPKDGIKYTGSSFLKLSEHLRNALNKYLETRGLTSRVANFLIEYMMCKDTEEYLRWLRTLKKLIEY